MRAQAVGKTPEQVLPASLSEAERQLVRTHPLIGDRILGALAREHGHALVARTPGDPAPPRRLR